MTSNDELWLLEEPIDDPADLLAISEMKQVVHEHEDEGLGLRLLLEHPEALSKNLWAQAA